MSNTPFTARTTVVRTQGGKALPTSYGEMLDPNRVQDIMNKLDDHDGALDRTEPVEVLDTTATNLSVACKRTHLTVSGAMTFTLPNGTVQGQIKEIECTSAASSPDATLTITTPTGSEPGAHHFTAVGQYLRLVWDGTGWHTVDKRRAGTQAVTVGTTVLTGYDMALVYNLSVTATVHSTGTMGIPAPQLTGETMYVRTGTAASLPVGDINIAGFTKAEVAATSLSAINATTCTAQFLGGADGWHNVNVTTATYS